MTTSIDAVLSVAASQLGGRYPGNSPYGLWYAERHGAVYRNAQFCAMGLSWCFNKVGGLDIFPEHAYTPSGAAWFKARGQWHTGSLSKIRRGDILYFDFPDSLRRIQHVGIAEKDGTARGVQTIEFNTTGQLSGGSQSNGRMVVRKFRTGYIVGWGRPAYSSSAPIPSRDYVQRGDAGARVRELQLKLIAAGYSVGPYGADGDFGADTEKAVIAFQRARNLDPDGIAGPATFGALDKPVFHGQPGVHTGRLTADGNFELICDGDLGGGTTARWSQIMGVPTNQGKSRDLIIADQKFLNSVLAGQGHIANLDRNQRRRQDWLTEDGLDDFDNTHTSAVRQFWLRNAMNPGHQQNLIGQLLDFDGYFKVQSIKVLQFALNNAYAGTKQYGRV